jgi:hypothetical protein
LACNASIELKREDNIVNVVVSAVRIGHGGRSGGTFRYGGFLENLKMRDTWCAEILLRMKLRRTSSWDKSLVVKELGGN